VCCAFLRLPARTGKQERREWTLLRRAFAARGVTRIFTGVQFADAVLYRHVLRCPDGVRGFSLP
jgi:hypothetical protein